MYSFTSASVSVEHFKRAARSPSPGVPAGGVGLVGIVCGLQSQLRRKNGIPKLITFLFLLRGDQAWRDMTAVFWISIIFFQKFVDNEYSGYAPITELRMQDINDILVQLAKENPKTHKPTSKATIKKLRNAAYNIFEMAVDSRVIEINPIRIQNGKRAAIGAAAIPRRALTKEERFWIQDTPHRAQRAAMIGMYAGLRRGELIPLQWDSVRLEERQIVVERFVEFDANIPVVKMEGKSESAFRVIDIPQVLADFLREEKLKDLRSGIINTLVCPDTRGKMYTSSGWRALWNSYLADLNIKYGHSIRSDGRPVTSKYIREPIKLTIPNITAHWLRHTYATILYMSGVDVLTAKEQLGHADIKTTLEIYTHLDKLYKRKNMQKLDDFLSGELTNANVERQNSSCVICSP